MFGKDQDVYQQLSKLHDRYRLHGIKAEFEAEGSSFRDVMGLRRLTAAKEVELHLKIGGVEAVRDIKDAYNIGVDGLIGPMVESRFGAKKFIDAVGSIYGTDRPHLTLNLETKNAMDQFDEILEYAVGRVDSITIGRSDLSGSYFDKNIVPDSDFVIGLIESVGARMKGSGLSLTVGGSIAKSTVKILKQNSALAKVISHVETRKIMLPTDVFLTQESVLEEALKFEELYILAKVSMSDLFNKSEVSRLMQLRGRLT